MQRKPGFDVVRMQDDMAAKGWQATDLASRAKVAVSSVTRFFSGESRTAPMAKKLAKALGYSLSRYLIRASDEAIAS